MKKLLLVLFLNIFLCFSAIAEVKNFQCLLKLNYVDESGKLVAFLVNTTKASLIFEKAKIGEIDQWNSNVYGKATFVFGGEKEEFTINNYTMIDARPAFNGYFYNRIDKEYINEDFNRDLKLKDKKGRLVKLKVIKFLPIDENKKSYHLTITRTFGLHTLESHRNDATIEIDNFICS